MSRTRITCTRSVVDEQRLLCRRDARGQRQIRTPPGAARVTVGSRSVFGFGSIISRPPNLRISMAAAYSVATRLRATTHMPARGDLVAAGSVPMIRSGSLTRVGSVCLRTSGASLSHWIPFRLTRGLVRCWTVRTTALGQRLVSGGCSAVDACLESQLRWSGTTGGLQAGGRVRQTVPLVVEKDRGGVGVRQRQLAAGAGGCGGVAGLLRVGLRG